MKSNRSLSEIRAEEQLRQERDSFEQHKRRDERSFLIRQRIVGASVLAMLAILSTAIWILTHPERYHALTVTAAGTAVFVQILGAMVFVWKTTVNPNSSERVRPITVAGYVSTASKDVKPNKTKDD